MLPELLPEYDSPVSKARDARMTLCKIAQPRHCHIVLAEQALIVMPRDLKHATLSKGVELLLQLRKHVISAERHALSLAARLDGNLIHINAAAAQTRSKGLTCDAGGDSPD